MMHRFVIMSIVLLAAIFTIVFSQDDFAPEVAIKPEFSAELSLSFNYDYLMSPLQISFDYPRGYLGINIPIKYSPPASLQATLTGDLPSDVIDTTFVPNTVAKQNANSTVKIDVPMLGGVCTFSYMQMMYMRFKNMLLAPGLKIAQGGGDDPFALSISGLMSVPLDINMGWETMTFGYAFQVNDKLSVAFNLHRHSFVFDLKGRVDVDIYGGYELLVEEMGYSIGGNIDYQLHNTIDGHYEDVTWTPSFAIKFWRMSMVSRFGMDIEPDGYLDAHYVVPFFIDPETFQIEALDEEYLIDNFDNFKNNAVNEVRYTTKKNLTWKMPQAHSLKFDIIPEKLSLSYTKLFGDIELSIFDPEADSLGFADSTNYNDTLNFSFKASIDHMIMIHGSFYNAFFNIGIYSMDFSIGNNVNILSQAIPELQFGDGILTPVLNLGAKLGSKMQLLLELDILPLPAVKSGIVYYF